jgi:hypothetical protein
VQHLPDEPALRLDSRPLLHDEHGHQPVGDQEKDRQDRQQSVLLGSDWSFRSYGHIRDQRRQMAPRSQPSYIRLPQGRCSYPATSMAKAKPLKPIRLAGFDLGQPPLWMCNRMHIMVMRVGLAGRHTVKSLAKQGFGWSQPLSSLTSQRTNILNRRSGGETAAECAETASAGRGRPGSIHKLIVLIFRPRPAWQLWPAACSTCLRRSFRSWRRASTFRRGSLW